MKTIKILFLLLFITSCGINDNLEEDCGCEKTTFSKIDKSTQYIENIEYTLLSVEDVACAEEVFEVYLSGNIFYSIKCDK